MRKPRNTTALAVVAAGAMMYLGVLGATIAPAVAPGAVAESSTGSNGSAGATRTMTTAPSELPIPMARPAITGPAPLPLEEQGLPG